jgi:hypothetical protein
MLNHKLLSLFFFCSWPLFLRRSKDNNITVIQGSHLGVFILKFRFIIFCFLPFFLYLNIHFLETRMFCVIQYVFPAGFFISIIFLFNAILMVIERLQGEIPSFKKMTFSLDWYSRHFCDTIWIFFRQVFSFPWFLYSMCF